MVTIKLKYFIILTLLLPLVYGESSDAVLELTDGTFEQAITKGNHFVMFFAPWCGHCKRLHPLWDQLAELKHGEADSNVVIAKVDCTENKLVCTEQQISGYPTLRFFKENEIESTKFKGTRDLPAFIEFINEQLNKKQEVDVNAEHQPAEPKGKLVELTDDNFAKHVSSGNHFVKFYAPWCGHCQRLAPTWEELAKSMEPQVQVSIAKIDCTVYRSICQDFEVKGYPTLLWIEDGKKIEKYSGSRELDALSAYVKNMLGVNKEAEAEEDEKNNEALERVIQLNADKFNNVIAEDVTFVKFYAPWCGHCQKLSPTWDELAQKVHTKKSGVKIAKMDCTEADNRNLCVEQQVEGYPTLFIYKNGEKLNEYEGARSLPELERYIQKILGHDEL